MDKVRIFPQGEYVEKHKQLQEEWRKNFRDFAAKVGHMTGSAIKWILWIQLNSEINLISVHKKKPTTLLLKNRSTRLWRRTCKNGKGSWPVIIRRRLTIRWFFRQGNTKRNKSTCSSSGETSVGTITWG